MSLKGTILILLAGLMVFFGVFVLVTGISAVWVPYAFAVLWAVTGVVAIDYFKKV